MRGTQIAMSWREVAAGGRFIVAMFLLNSCHATYPYLVMNDDCRCEEYRYDDPAGITIAIKARYTVGDVVATKIEMTIVNHSNDTLDLRQGFVKGTSRNVRYASNDRFLPLPFITLLPGERSRFTLEGEDTDRGDDPWLKIAGEQVAIELRRMFLGGRELPPLNFRLVPQNPKLTL